MKRRHSNPLFGPRILPTGEIEFRLWAPAARRVDLLLLQGQEELALPMNRQTNGFHEIRTGLARPGTRYRFLINGELRVPDPAARFQPGDVHGESEVIDPETYDWQDANWRGRPWESAVVYELHVGTFTPQGTFRGVIERLPWLATLGITAIELMPVSDFPGARNWGYDGVLPYAPEAHYGRPEDLKALIDAAHELGLMMMLDVVYNHFGPEGNYLHAYAPQFFTERYHTPWGAAINFDGPDSRFVRDFFVDNALYWLTEYHFDGLRLDAVHAIFDRSTPDIVEEIAQAVRAGPGRDRHVHLVLENDNNAAHYLDTLYDAQWNDDVHHALHVLLTGEHDGYYADYAQVPIHHLGRCLTQGFAYQGEHSHYRNGAQRGEPSRHLPLTAFVSLLQNHDQIGNRAFGERISVLASPAALRAATVLLLLAPAPPLIFMGQEWNTKTPFPFFCDFGPELAQAVTEGRRQEFARFPQFADMRSRERIPDPNAKTTFESAMLEWSAADDEEGQAWIALHRELLAIRKREIVPRLRGAVGTDADYEILGDCALFATWRLHDANLVLLANFGATPVVASRPSGRALYVSDRNVVANLADNLLPSLAVAWFLDTK